MRKKNIGRRYIKNIWMCIPLKTPKPRAELLEIELESSGPRCLSSIAKRLKITQLAIEKLYNYQPIAELRSYMLNSN